MTDLRNPGVSSAFQDNGGVVNIYGQLNDPGTLTIGNAWQLVGGSVTGTTISGAGTFTMTSSDGTLDGVTLNVDRTLLAGRR